MYNNYIGSIIFLFGEIVVSTHTTPAAADRNKKSPQILSNFAWQNHRNHVVILTRELLLRYQKNVENDKAKFKVVMPSLAPPVSFNLLLSSQTTVFIQFSNHAHCVLSWQKLRNFRTSTYIFYRIFIGYYTLLFQVQKSETKHVKITPSDDINGLLILCKMICILLTWIWTQCLRLWSHGEFLIVAVSLDDNKWPSRKPMINLCVANTDKTPFITWSTIKIPLAIQHSLCVAEVYSRYI